VKRMITIIAVAMTVAGLAAADFSRERTIEPFAAGPRRLDLDVHVLTGSKPLRYSAAGFAGGLEDLRLFDGGGTEVPYLLVAPEPASEEWVRGRVLAIRETRKESGFELDLGSIKEIDAIRLLDLPAPFLKRFRLEGSGDRTRWSLLVEEGTLFDLPDDDLSLRKIEFGADRFRYLRITWDDRSSGRIRLPSLAEARPVRGASASPALFETKFMRRESEPRRSRFRVKLPARSLPAVAIILECEEGTLSRDATVNESRLAAGEAVPVTVGLAKLKKVERDGVIVGNLRIPIQRPAGPDLELVVEDGDNPPLRLTRIRVELPPLPWIYFEGDAVVARWDAGALEAPRYDLEARREQVTPALASRAEWGTVAEAEAGGPSAAMTFEGAPVDPGSFRYSKPVPASLAGLTSLLLDAEVVAHANGLADIRIVDSEDRQVPYLIERRGEPLTIPLTAGEREPMDGGRSRYVVELPWSTLRDTRLVLETGSRVFDRSVQIVETEPAPGERDPRILAVAQWTHADPEIEPPALLVDVPLAGRERIAIVIDEGDNAPIDLASVDLLLPMVRLRFVRSEGDRLALVYGNANAQAPRYDIELMARRLFGVSAEEIEPGRETENRDLPSETKQRTWFWVIVAAAAVAIFAIIGRLLRTQE